MHVRVICVDDAERLRIANATCFDSVALCLYSSSYSTYIRLGSRVTDERHVGKQSDGLHE